ncbi:hypothetical protein [Treponema phagedenis]|uniref:hypothetical protein n=1 Tax=Treponema phagedenis TaxID=162 RepID=UPI0001F63C21|nr:hypothetical protein [Treponema phagedenis]EFW38066.1 hypothetical protein HMPREF9554_01441 [Treponema phagedenis F0421]TYT78431.1 hypothetical protein FS559_04510 [Treponema phagedenis]
MDAMKILRPLFEKGDLKQSIALAAVEHQDLETVQHEGLNFITASILADVPTIKKMDLIKKTGALFGSKDYCDLLNQKVFTIHPAKRDILREQKVLLTDESIKPHYAWYNIFDIAFPWLPLSIFEDFVVYLHDDKGLVLDKETVNIVKENFTNSKRYSERELETCFNSSLFRDPE